MVKREISLEEVSVDTLYKVYNILARELASCLDAVVVLIFHMDHKFILITLHT